MIRVKDIDMWMLAEDAFLLNWSCLPAKVLCRMNEAAGTINHVLHPEDGKR